MAIPILVALAALLPLQVQAQEGSGVVSATTMAAFESLRSEELQVAAAASNLVRHALVRAAWRNDSTAMRIVTDSLVAIASESGGRAASYAVSMLIARWGDAVRVIASVEQLLTIVERSPSPGPRGVAVRLIGRHDDRAAAQRALIDIAIAPVDGIGREAVFAILAFTQWPNGWPILEQLQRTNLVKEPEARELLEDLVAHPLRRPGRIR